MVGEKGLEPSRLAAIVPKTIVSAIPPLARDKPPLNDLHQWGYPLKGGPKNSVYKRLLGPPVSNTIRVNMVAITTMSIPTISLPDCLSGSGPR